MAKQLNQPPINDLEKKAGCRYALVNAVSIKAKTLVDNSCNFEDKTDKQHYATLADNAAVEEAIEEFNEGKYKIKK